MFKKDYELLNEAYDKRVMELNMGQRVQDGPSEGLSPEKRIKITAKKIVKDGVVTKGVSEPMKRMVTAQIPAAAAGTQTGTQTNQPVTGAQAAAPGQAEETLEDDENCEECGGACGASQEDTDSDAYMAKQLIYRIFKLSSMLYPLIRSNDKVEAWVLDKLSKAHDNLNSAFSYKDFEQFKNTLLAAGGLQEETEIDLYNAISRGGDSLIDNIKKVLHKESREVKEKLFVEIIKQLDS